MKLELASYSKGGMAPLLASEDGVASVLVSYSKKKA